MLDLTPHVLTTKSYSYLDDKGSPKAAFMRDSVKYVIGQSFRLFAPRVRVGPAYLPVSRGDQPKIAIS